MQRWSGKQIRTLIGSVIGACVVGYFVYHAVQGDRGMITMLQLQNQVREAQQFLSQVRKERLNLERRVKLINGNAVDPDMLEEQSRTQLNHAKPNELIILTPENKDNNMPQRSKD